MEWSSTFQLDVLGEQYDKKESAVGRTGYYTDVEGRIGYLQEDLEIHEPLGSRGRRQVHEAIVGFRTHLEDLRRFLELPGTPQSLNHIHGSPRKPGGPLLAPAAFADMLTWLDCVQKDIEDRYQLDGVPDGEVG
jgi:hypothetical protein